MHATNRQSSDNGDIAFRALPFEGDDGLNRRLLTPHQRQKLLSVATRVTFRPRDTIYREHAPATSVFICMEGAVKSFRHLPSGKRRVCAFLFSHDLFGLAENGRYVNTTQALVQTTCYRVPLNPLREVLRADAELQYHFLCKVIHELRELQFRTIILGRRSAAGRVAMFLTMLERNLPAHTKTTIALPMSRTDIADFLGLSSESVSRAAGRLVNRGMIAFPDGHSVRVLDRQALERLATSV